MDLAALFPCGHPRPAGSPLITSHESCPGYDHKAYTEAVERLVLGASGLVCTEGCHKDAEPGHHDFCQFGPVLEALAPFQPKESA